MSVVDDLAAAVDAVCAADAGSLADGDTVVALHRQLDRLEAATARACAAFDARAGHEADGARTAAHWLASRCPLPVAVARRRVRLGRALRHLPHAEAAWLAGDIGAAHVALLADARTTATDAALARDEPLLVGHATELGFRPFARALAYWVQHADPDGTEQRAGRQRDRRRVHVSPTFDGAWVVDGVLDPIAGAIVDGELRRIADELFAADWAEARGRVGDAVATAHLCRTTAQRRADALVEMARRSAAAPAGARPPAPLFTVLVGYETFAGRVCELADGTVVTPGSLVPWLDRAVVERVVFDGPSRVVDVGVRRRLFAGATRRAVEVRDRECYHPTCHLPAERCEIDHVRPYAAGGPTTQANGRPACGYHNRRRSRPP